MAVEQTFVIIKPEAVERKLIGEILGRFERKGLEVKRLAVTEIQKETAEEHYAHHQDKSFFPQLIEAITSGPVVLVVLEGDNAIEQVRTLIELPTLLQPLPVPSGEIWPLDSRTIWCMPDSPAAAEAEIKRFFGD